MAKDLVIVESPAKAKTINRFLGDSYRVEASMGHLKDLPVNELGVEIEDGFKPHYVVIEGKEKILNKLKKTAKKSDRVYLAADPDREGEAICWHIAGEIQDNSEVRRVLFQEITKNSIKEAFENPTSIDMNKVNAQQARRILDRLVGYKLSPLLWKKVQRGLSAGRVQSVALRIIVDREKEIEAFEPEEYWTVKGLFANRESSEFTAKLVKKDDSKIDIGNEREVEKTVEELKELTYNISKLKAKEKKRKPYPPFITSHLQREAHKVFNFSVKKTMMLAQRLYEGKELGGYGTVGLITYMRTDSYRVSKSSVMAMRDYVEGEYGEDYLSSSPRIYKAGEDAQDAHEAIRPTSMEFPPEKIKSHLEKDELKLYKLIWGRFAASQMGPAVYDSTKVELSGGDYLFRAKGSRMKFKGFMEAYPYVRSKKDVILPDLKKGEQVELKDLDPKQHFTKPPARYSEATLVKELENNGVGRPSTYANILTKIQNKDYVSRKKNRFHPSDLGMIVSDLLVENFKDLLDIGYTARMEEVLDKVEEGKVDWVEALKDFYTNFKEDLEKARDEMESLKKPPEPTDQECPKCGAQLMKRTGRFGEFLGCSKYPKCDYTQEIEGSEDEDEELPEIDCPNCEKEMIVKSGRYGKFLACSGHPDCKTTLNLAEKEDGSIELEKNAILDEKCPECGSVLAKKRGGSGTFTACSTYPDCRYIKAQKTGVKCPEEDCEGEIVVKKTRGGKEFYGCDKYPDCEYALWNLPVDRKCPECGFDFLARKERKTKADVIYCPSDDCDYSKEVDED